MLYLLIGHNYLLIFLTETQHNVKGKMMSCFVALMALDIGEIKPLLKKGANLTLASSNLAHHSVQFLKSLSFKCEKHRVVG